MTEFEGPPEPLIIPCAYCGGLITTLWAPAHRGMLSSEDHCLIGDQVCHCDCLNASLLTMPPK